jgi:hypothetical protein
MMGARKKSNQSEAFIRTARELGCDADQVMFERAIRQIARPRPGSRRRPIVEKKKQSRG